MIRPHWSVAAAALTVAAVGCSGATSSQAPASARTSSPARASSTSGSIPSDGGHAAFVARVEAICQRAVDAHAGHSFPLASFDPLHPDPQQLPAVGAYFANYGQLPSVVAALHKLTPAAVDSAEWHALLQTADAVATNAQQQIAAAQQRNVTAFVRTVHASASLASSIDQAGRRLGFSSESACGQVFG